MFSSNGTAVHFQQALINRCYNGGNFQISPKKMVTVGDDMEGMLFAEKEISKKHKHVLNEHESYGVVTDLSICFTITVRA